ncbi:putative receptor-like protein kinase [Capsicum baccatum]|uniref:Receptor-like protein kinase n=1 Tax=Capsicum baccatum TaxID=33114 RepID=A0A2G2VK79_CAPBA|nr:putative receptor-like protein kinase [Capsicum baccatum]
MAITSFVSFVLSLHLILLQAKGRNDSICLVSFSCGNLTDLSFPFSLSTQPDCRIIPISHCDAKPYPRFQLLPGGDWYYATAKPNNSTIWLRDPKIHAMLRQHNCQAFNRSFSFQDSPSISFTTPTLHSFLKCNSTSHNASNITEKKIDHFAGYRMYNGCKGFSIYYKLSGYVDEDIRAGNLPSNCSLIRLPIDSASYDVDVFKILSHVFLVEWELSYNCYLCHQGGGQCQTDKTNKFHCTYPNTPNAQDAKATKSKFGLMLGTEVKRITNGFKDKLGQGRYGSVYKGCLHNGSNVAVKLLKKLKGSGEEFINEMASISKTSHVNIVSLVGFCFEGRKRALVYEFMPNGSLEKFIYEERSDTVRQLGWPTLYKIALGTARGLEYLHRGCTTRILHFDIKPHNILLDEDFCPKISDFGLAKLCVKKESIVSVLGARGTIGYIAPEIVCRNLGGVSRKSDVYSYGMMVLEMVGGRKNVDAGADRTSEIYFPHWLYRRIELDEELQLIGIMNEEKEYAKKMVMVSLCCIQTDPSNRPSMTKVVEMLEGNLDSMQIPPKPYLYSSSRTEVDSSAAELA